MKVVVTGANGQLGRELHRTVPESIELIATSRDDLDITDLKRVEHVLREHEPDFVINAAAYTAVDRAEEDPEAAFAVNSRGAANIARVLASQSGRMIQISTDFVFPGDSGNPYKPDSPTGPVGTYGASKLEGERQVQAALEKRSVILRTAWVYSRFGHNFVKTMLRLMGELDVVEVVDDQVGSPTWAHDLAEVVWQLVDRKEPGGVFHWTDSGVASWYDFAVAIRDEARAAGRLDSDCRVEPTTTSLRPTAATRPAFSVLDKSSTWALLGHRAPHWRLQLGRMLAEFEI